MWFLHVVVAVHSPSGWPTGLTLWIVSALVGGGFSYWSGAAAGPDGLWLDLMLAALGAIGGAVVSAPLAGDPVAVVYRVPLLWAALGAALVVLLGRDVLSSGNRPLSVHGAGARGPALPGGFSYLIPRLTGWPSAPGLLEGSDAEGLPIKLTAAAVHYQVRIGPFRAARLLPLLPGLTVTQQDRACTLLRHLLEASRGQAQAAGLSITDVAVQQLVAEAAAVVQPLMNRRQNVLRLDAPSDLGVVRTDHHKVRHRLIDLLAHASNFVERGTIVLTAGWIRKPDGAALRISITGTGAVRGEDQCSKQPATSNTTTNTTTTTICRSLGGTIAVEDDPLGNWSFAMTVPGCADEARSPVEAA